MFGRSSKVLKWVPLGPIFDTPSQGKKDSPVIGWEKINVEDEEVLPKTCEAFLKRFPETFQQEARFVWKRIQALDQNFPEAVKDPEVRVFVTHLARSGFIGHVYHQDGMRNLYPDAPQAYRCLPRWLQYDVLRTQLIAMGTEELTAIQKEKVTRDFNKFTSKFPFKETGNGRYFTISPTKEECSLPRQYKCYLEGEVLMTALEDGSLQRAFTELRQQELGLECKLFEGDRLVIYGKSDIRSIRAFLDVFKKHRITARGPAQDVWTVKIKDDQSIGLEVTYSNDSALGDAGKFPESLDYHLKAYSPSAFMEWYLKVCAFSGKSPLDPYRTSFVYAIAKDVLNDPTKMVKKATEFCGYPVHLAEGRR